MVMMVQLLVKLYSGDDATILAVMMVTDRE